MHGTLIRREVTADRGLKHAVSTNEVLDCIESIGREHFTTHDVAAELAVRNPEIPFSALEYAARTAILWLRRRRIVEKTDKVVFRQRSLYQPYRIAVYAYHKQGAPADCALLNKIFFGLGEYA